MKLGTSGGRQARTRVNASKYGRGREHVNKQAGLNEEPARPTEGRYSFKLIFYLLKVVHILTMYNLDWGANERERQRRTGNGRRARVNAARTSVGGHESKQGRG